MKRYGHYKYSGVKWIGEIPNHWKVEPFGRHFRFGKGLPITKADLLPEGISVISYGQIHSKLNTGTKITSNLVRFVSPDYLASNSRSLLHKNDFIFADTSEDIEGSGNCAFNHSDKAIFAGYHTVIAKPIDLKIPRYYAYLFQSRPWRNQVQSLVNGVKVYSINKSILKRTSLLFPSLEEQEQIVNFLETKTLKIDSYERERERELRLLEELKHSEIANAITKGLNTGVPYKPTGLSWLPFIPEHWELKRLGTAFTENKTKNSDFLYKNAMKFYYGTLEDKKESFDTDEIEDTYAKYTVLQKGDIVINGLNLNYDFVSQRVAISPKDGIITSAYIAIRPRKIETAKFFCYLFKCMDSMKLFHGMGTGIRLTLSFQELKKQLIPIPPPDEMQKIVEYVDTKLNIINELIEDLQLQLQQINEYKQRLIADVVTGKINVQNN